MPIEQGMISRIIESAQKSRRNYLIPETFAGIWWRAKPPREVIYGKRQEIWRVWGPGTFVRPIPARREGWVGRFNLITRHTATPGLEAYPTQAECESLSRDEQGDNRQNPPRNDFGNGEQEIESNSFHTAPKTVRWNITEIIQTVSPYFLYPMPKNHRIIRGRQTKSWKILMEQILLSIY